MYSEVKEKLNKNTKNLVKQKCSSSLISKEWHIEIVTSDQRELENEWKFMNIKSTENRNLEI